MVERFPRLVFLLALSIAVTSAILIYVPQLRGAIEALAGPDRVARQQMITPFISPVVMLVSGAISIVFWAVDRSFKRN